MNSIIEWTALAAPLDKVMAHSKREKKILHMDCSMSHVINIIRYSSSHRSDFEAGLVLVLSKQNAALFLHHTLYEIMKNCSWLFQSKSPEHLFALYYVRSLLQSTNVDIDILMICLFWAVLKTLRFLLDLEKIFTHLDFMFPLQSICIHPFEPNWPADHPLPSPFSPTHIRENIFSALSKDMILAHGERTISELSHKTKH